MHIKGNSHTGWHTNDPNRSSIKNACVDYTTYTLSVHRYVCQLYLSSDGLCYC